MRWHVLISMMLAGTLGARAQVVGQKYSAIFGFENDADASKAATLIKKAGTRARK